MKLTALIDFSQVKKHGEPTEHIVRCTKNLCDAYHFEKADWERVYGEKNKALCAKVSQSVSQPVRAGVD
jgi:hypothetical protein